MEHSLNRLIIFIVLVAVLIVAGCSTSNQTSNSQAAVSQNGISQKGVAHFSSQGPSGYVAQSSDYTCFAMNGVTETDIASGYLGGNIADTRRVTGTLTNNCGKIMSFALDVRWFDPSGIPAYYWLPSGGFFRLKPGESTPIQCDGMQADPKYGYIEETSGWTYKIGIGSTLPDLE